MASSNRYWLKSVLDERKQPSEEENNMVEEFLKTHGVQKCPPALLNGSELKESAQKQYAELRKQWRKDNKGYKKNRVKVDE